MPQLDIATFPSQIFWLGICFLALYFTLAYFVIPRIVGVLENREYVCEEKLNQASTYRAQAEDLLVEYEKMLAQARENAHQRYQSTVNATTLDMTQKKKDMLDKLQERLHMAEQELYRARLEASADIQSVAPEIAGEILQKLTGHIYSADQLVVAKDAR